MVVKRAPQNICYKKEALDPTGLKIFALQITSFNPFTLWKSSPERSPGSSYGKYRGFPQQVILV